jgi:hypothetical protein
MAHGPLGINGEHILFYFGSFEKHFSQIDPWKYILDMDPLKGAGAGLASFKGSISGICFRGLFVKNIKKRPK